MLLGLEIVIKEDKLVEAIADNAPSVIFIVPAPARLPIATRPSESDGTELTPLKSNDEEAMPDCEDDIAS